MSLSGKDLDVFILTYNRADFLAVTIQSLLEQRLKGFSITVLDNASTDHTREVVARFAGDGVRIESAPSNLGAVGNLQRSQQLATRRYVMLFHDDDQLHPEYLETVLDQFSRHEDAAVAVANSVWVEAGVLQKSHDSLAASALKVDQAHFAALLYLQNKIAFCSAVYRRDALLAIDFVQMFDTYGKWTDRPIMTEALQGGQSALILTSPYVLSGRHPEQDTHTAQTQPPHHLWLNRERYCRSLMGDGFSSIPSICFRCFNHRRLKSGYKRRIQAGISFEAYLADAFAIGAATPTSWRMRWFAPKPIQKIITSYVKRCILARFSV